MTMPLAKERYQLERDLKQYELEKERTLTERVKAEADVKKAEIEARKLELERQADIAAVEAKKAEEIAKADADAKKTEIEANTKKAEAENKAKTEHDKFEFALWEWGTICVTVILGILIVVFSQYSLKWDKYEITPKITVPERK